MNTKDLINHLTEDIIKLYDIKIPITDIDAVVEKLGGKVVNTSELQHKMENCYIKKHKDAFVMDRRYSIQKKLCFSYRRCKERVDGI